MDLNRVRKGKNLRTLTDYEMDFFAGIYGVNDLVFMIFFIRAFVARGRER